MKPSLRQLLLILCTTAATTTTTLAHADFLGALKNAASKEFGAPAASAESTASPLSSVLPGDLTSLTPASTANAAGILQFCVKNNILSGNNAEHIKNQLMGKLGIDTQEQAKQPDFQDGLKGILHGKGTGDVNLANLGAGTSKLKAQVTEKACDLVLDHAKSFL